MGTLGKPVGIFDLNDSDKSVGSFLSRHDIREILSVNDNDLNFLQFKKIGNIEIIDERIIQKHWYANEIPNAKPVDKSSLDELILIAIIKKTFPDIAVERQIKIGKFSMDLKLTLNGKTIFIEFDGPTHFTISKYGEPKPPFRKKEIIEDKTGFEVINWAYWIQRCSSNVKALFDDSIRGYGVLWSTEIHFGMFAFQNSAEIIETITKRFNAIDESGFGYFYGGETRQRNNPEHPIIRKIIQGKVSAEKLLPQGWTEKNYWLPDTVIKMMDSQ